MPNILLIVEGQTEEKFYKTIFAKEFSQHIFKVVIMPGKRKFMSVKDRGGRVAYTVCVSNIKRYLDENTNCNLVALIFDYYGLDKSFKSHLEVRERELSLKISSIIQRFENEIDNKRFKFFLQVHEFESYLFSDIDKIANHFHSIESKEKLKKIIIEFNKNPELINDSKETAPSKRLGKIFPGFAKTVDGLKIIEEIGIPTIRMKCVYFK